MRPKYVDEVRVLAEFDPQSALRHIMHDVRCLVASNYMYMRLLWYNLFTALQVIVATNIAETSVTIAGIVHGTP